MAVVTHYLSLTAAAAAAHTLCNNNSTTATTTTTATTATTQKKTQRPRHKSMPINTHLVVYQKRRRL